MEFNDELDKESREALLEGSKAERLVASEDWKWAREKLVDMISVTLSLETLTEFKTATALQLEVASRKRAAGIVKAWLEVVEGLSTQHKFNKQQQASDDNFVVRLKE